MADKYYKKYDDRVDEVFDVTNPEEIAVREKAIADAKPGAKIKKQIKASSNLYMPQVAQIELKLNPYEIDKKV